MYEYYVMTPMGLRSVSYEDLFKENFNYYDEEIVEQDPSENFYLTKKNEPLNMDPTDLALKSNDEMTRKSHSIEWSKRYYCNRKVEIEVDMTLYDNGSYNIVANISNHTKYRYRYTLQFSFMFKATNNTICYLETITEVRNPYESKASPKGGYGDMCIKNNFKLIEEQEIIGGLSVNCYKLS